MRPSLSALLCACLLPAAFARMPSPEPQQGHQLPAPAVIMLPAPPLAAQLEPLLPHLQLNSKQQALWLKAETASQDLHLAQKREQQQARINLRDKLQDNALSLSQALQQSAAGDVRPLPDGRSPQWHAFLDSLDTQQSALVRQCLLAYLNGEFASPQAPHQP